MNKVFQVIYSEARNGYVVVSELVKAHGKGGHGRRSKSAVLTAAVLSALASFSWADMHVVQAATVDKPRVVTEKDQTISDDFGSASHPVSITDGRTMAVLEIAPSAAADDKGVTTVNSNTINGKFTQPADRRFAEAIGVLVQDNYPGTVQLADGLQVNVDATGNRYNSAGIYLDGADVHKDPTGEHDESEAANAEWEKNGGHISSKTVNVGTGTTITVNAKAPAEKAGDYVNAQVLENHFSHMTVGDSVHLSLHTGPFKENYSDGFIQHFYGETVIGNGFASTVTVDIDKDAKDVRVTALRSSHDRPTDHQLPAKTQNSLRIGDDAHLKLTVNDHDTNDYTDGQLINATGAFLSETDFTIGNRMTVDTEQIGEPGRKGSASNKLTGLVGIFTRAVNDSHIGADLKNTVTVKNRDMEYVNGIHFSGWMQDRFSGQMQDGIRPDDPTKDTSTVSIGAGSMNQIDVQNSIVGNGITAIEVDSDSHISLGEKSFSRIDVKDSILGHSIIGIGVDASSQVKLGSDSGLSISQTGGKSDGIFGIMDTDGSQIEAGLNGSLSISQTGGKSNTIYGVYASGDSVLKLSSNFHANIDVKGDSTSVWVVKPDPKGTIFADDGLNVHASYEGGTKQNVTVGAFNYRGNLTVGNHGTLDVSGHYTGEKTAGTVVSGLRTIEGTSTYGSNLTVAARGDNYETVEGLRGYGETGQPALTVIGNGLNMTVKASALQDNANGPIVYGIKNSGNDSKIKIGRDAHISLSAPDAVQDLAVVRSWRYGNTELDDGAVLTVNSKAQDSKGKIVNNVVKADSAGKVTFDGGMTLVGSKNAIYSTDDGSSVTATGNGRKVILGDLESADKGSIQLKLNTGDSFFRGKSIIDPSAKATDAAMADTTSADTELTLESGARWDMTGTSQLTKLTHENGGLVNMAYNPSYQRLDVNAYSGKDGIFRMKTDLASQTDGDKVYMNGAGEDSHGLVQVHDQSFLTGKEVTGTKHLLLITDNSQKATFRGQTLDEGGLWDVTPTIQNGSYVRNTMGVKDAKDTQWYLTKLERSINRDTKPLIGASDYAYGLYRNDIETLRQRMGELRFLKDKQDESGIWARMYGGEFAGPGYDSRYHAVQLGYDYAADPKSFYGFFGERGISSPHYDYGTGSNHSLAAGLYGTWFGDSGVYTDAVAKWGRDDANLHTFGPYPDQASYRTRAASLSLEYGKTMKLNDKGLFLEPQAQLVYGHLGSTHYTTAREKQVNMEGYDSFIGRVGFVFGRRTPDATKPLDYYLRLSALHEFGGRRDLHLSASDGETMDWSRDYGSTWYEASLGGTYRLNNRTTLYGDLQRSFGSDWHKKWQGNIGINWQF